MNILYLLKCIDSNKLSDLTAAIDMPPIDLNLAIWGAIERGEIEIDENKDRVKALKDDAEAWHNPDLASKLIRVFQHYAENEANITRGRLSSYMKDPVTGQGYPIHEFVMTLQYLIDQGTIEEEVISVPELKGKRPYHRFVFLCLPGNDNQEWNAKAVNKWIADFEKAK